MIQVFEGYIIEEGTAGWPTYHLEDEHTGLFLETVLAESAGKRVRITVEALDDEEED